MLTAYICLERKAALRVHREKDSDPCRAFPPTSPSDRTFNLCSLSCLDDVSARISFAGDGAVRMDLELTKPYGDSVFNIKGMCKIMTDDERGSEVTAARNFHQQLHVESMGVDVRNHPLSRIKGLLRRHTVHSELIEHPWHLCSLNPTGAAFGNSQEDSEAHVWRAR